MPQAKIAHPVKFQSPAKNATKTTNTLPKCHMPKLQHHAKMSQIKADGWEHIAPAGRFF